jgi:23S rRNA-/tRNA-specific pseudouridylate synthase
LGDDLYGEPSALICRHALHSAELIFPHPTKEIPLTVRAPLPEDMQRVATHLGFETRDLP